ncbi:hypothetical protein PV08_01346 [Exophiala spinifera]|uniref:Uncharacterized protein n=1 Tax=Exophiala spinifera TaxID=91928 RepID=A0A0D2BPA6_9EURO|nr:uncharacterized protein PV08_01346 [Exophiala spinifera]KIW20768.1 hypothetical protein PV08_01346 [Exophiala spinifera]
MSNPQDYTVGWICAISTERVAARAFLDEEHAPPEYVQTNDNNDYTLGRVGKHNVVIAVAPDGEYGTQSAAAVARDMMHTFPNVRIGLMVGIAGGVPSHKQDIRLGDIVVSSPREGKGGVYQHDFGKRRQEQDFQTTGYLNQPPPVLRAAVAGLRSQYEEDGHQLEHAIDRVLEKKPRLRKKYQRPDPKNDRLYLSKIVHPANDERDCSEVCGQDPSQFVDRGIRTPEDDNPTIHYGLIASGNTVLKDALLRDAAAKDGVLCFEMEAAGLMNQFPCLVIRGICDYSDSHKNKQWQGYAAMAAAAYARDLLLRILPNRVEAEKPFRQTVSDSIKNVQDNIENLARGQQQQIERKDRRKLSEWLSPLIPYARHYENQKQRVNGTGKWLLEDSLFLEWSTATSPSVLFCYGDPGAGKTILSSLVIDHLHSTTAESTIGVGYIYSDYRDAKSQTAENILGAVLQQILGSLPEIPPEVWSLFRERLAKHLAFHLSDAKDLFQIASVKFGKIYICIDALDELNDQRRVLEFLRDRPSNLQLFLTGRPHVREIVREHLNVLQEVIVKARDYDIQQFIDREIGGPNDIEPSAMDDKLRTSIKEKLVQSAEGSFLLPVLQIRTILQCLTRRDRELSLKTLPSTLSEAFAGSFARIQQQPEALAYRAAQIVAWVHLTVRPLTESELLCALTVKNEDTRFEVRGIPVRRTLLNCCQGLVVMDRQTSTVRLVHFSLEEYLNRQNQIFEVSIRELHGRIAATCLTYLNFPTSAEDPDEDPNEDPDEDPNAHPEEDACVNVDIRMALLSYSARHWGIHLHHYEGEEGVDHVEPSVLNLAYKYLQLGWKRNPDSWKSLLEYMYWRDVPKTERRDLQAHVSAYFGLRSVISLFALRGLSLDRKDRMERTPLSWASERGHLGTVQLLLAKGVEVDLGDFFARTPLSWASKEGHLTTVQLLLDNGAAWNSEDDLGYTPLMRASEQGHLAIVQLLLHRGGATVNSEDEELSASLFCASGNGHLAIVQLLLRRGVTVNWEDPEGRTPLSWASENGHLAIVQLLLDHDAALNSKEEEKCASLLWASEWGHLAIVQLLLDRGAPVNSEDEEGRTPLSWASENGHLAILLLDRGAVVDSRDSGDRTPLSYATEFDSILVAELLIKEGAAVDSVDTTGRTPLSWCLAPEMALTWKEDTTETKAVAQLLIKNGAILDTRDDEGKTPLSHAAENADVMRMEILIELGAEVNSRDNNGRTPLSWCLSSKTEYSWTRTKKPWEIAARLLIKNGALRDPDTELDI